MPFTIAETVLFIIVFLGLGSSLISLILQSRYGIKTIMFPGLTIKMPEMAGVGALFGFIALVIFVMFSN